jgi:hypothetical protein
MEVQPREIRNYQGSDGTSPFEAWLNSYVFNLHENLYGDLLYGDLYEKRARCPHYNLLT